MKEKRRKRIESRSKRNGILALVSVCLMAIALFRAFSRYSSGDLITYDQRNDGAGSFIDQTSYEGENYNHTSIKDYLSEGSNYDDPEGYEIKMPAKAEKIQITDGKNTWTDTVTAGENYTIYNLIPGQLYDFDIMGKQGQTLKSGSFLPTGDLRMIYLNGPRNFRDLGGWEADGGKIRYGLLIRGAAIRRNEGLMVLDNDLSILSDQIGIKREIDLRANWEVAGEDAEIDTDDDITYTDIPGATYERISIGSYISSIDRTKDSYQNLVKALRTIMNYAVAGETTYYHCMVGADRTGTVSFLLEGLLGMSQSDMDKEYELTSFTESTSRPRNGNDYNYKKLVSYMEEIPDEDWQDKFIRWFSCAGFTTEEMNAFREAMIDGSSKKISATDHIYNEGEIVKEASISEEGILEQTCRICKEAKRETVPKLEAKLKLSSEEQTLRKKKSFVLEISEISLGDEIESVVSKDESVATVTKQDDTHYIITGRHAGQTKIKVKLTSGKKAKCKVTVY